MCREWLVENAKYEITRLQDIIRDPRASHVERATARDMLLQYDDGIDQFLARVYPNGAPNVDLQAGEDVNRVFPVTQEKS